MFCKYHIIKRVYHFFLLIRIQIEDIGVDGQIMDHVTDADLEQDFGIKVRLHRVKIIEGIKKL
jgi:hypothetical protein